MPNENSVDPLDLLPVIHLSGAKTGRENWGKPKSVIAIWLVCELIFVTNPWQLSSRIRVEVLRLFGAKIGKNVIFRQRTRVKFPWKLEIGDDCWIGEGVWFHNQDQISIGRNVVISQETMLSTGSHEFRKTMDLVTAPIKIEDGVWVTSRCMILYGVHIGKSALICPMTVVRGDVPANTIYSQNLDTSAPKARLKLDETGHAGQK